MRILHISDFHLDKKDKEDSKTHIVLPLLATLKKVIEESPIDIVFFTGDLLNIGGKNYNGMEEGFLDFEETLIEPLLNITNLLMGELTCKERYFFLLKE